MNIRIAALVAILTVVAGTVALWLFGAFDGEAPVAGVSQPPVATATNAEVSPPSSIPTTSTIVPVELIPPSSSVTKELESIGYAYDAATGTWRAVRSVGLPVLVLEGPEGKELVVKAKLGKLVCDVFPPFDQRPAALTIAMGSGMDENVRADATSAKPSIIEYTISGTRVGIFSCYRE